MAQCKKCGEPKKKGQKCNACRRANRKPLTAKQAAAAKIQQGAWREANRERDLANKKAHRWANVEAVREHDRDRHAANAEERNAKRRDKYKADPGHVKDLNKKSRTKHREKVRARDKVRAATPKARARRKAYRLDHLEEDRARNKQWRTNNPGRAKANNRRWVLEKPESASALKRAYKARKAGAFGSHSAAEWIQIKLAQDARCNHCPPDSPYRELHADHIVPLAHGGTDYSWNIQGLCGPCNSAKRVKFIGPINEYDRGPDGTWPILVEQWHPKARLWNQMRKE